MDLNTLFQPCKAGKLELGNRLAMAPMTRKCSPGGVPGEEVAAYYRRRAAGGIGLIITEGTAIDHPAAVNHDAIPRFYGEEAQQGWEQVVSEVHEAGGKIIPQLWHVGAARKRGDKPFPKQIPVGPSGLTPAGVKIAEPMKESEIADIIEAFGKAAGDAKRIGFDGIELHGAHGYLIDQFFWAKTNKRKDAYGGDLRARLKFGIEVVEACRRAAGSDFPIVFRFSQWKTGNYEARLADTPKQLASFLEPLAAAGVDVFHCSTRQFWLPEFQDSGLNLAGWTKKLTGLPTITVGSVGLDSDFINRGTEASDPAFDSLERLMERLHNDEFDLAAIGRPLIADPEWALKIKEGRFSEIVPYTHDSEKTLN